MSTFDHSHIEHAVDSLRSEGRDHHLDREPESGHSHKSSRSRHSNRRHWFFGGGGCRKSHRSKKSHKSYRSKKSRCSKKSVKSEKPCKSKKSCRSKKSEPKKSHRSHRSKRSHHHKRSHSCRRCGKKKHHSRPQGNVDRKWDQGNMWEYRRYR